MNSREFLNQTTLISLRSFAKNWKGALACLYKKLGIWSWSFSKTWFTLTQSSSKSRFLN